MTEAINPDDKKKIERAKQKKLERILYIIVGIVIVLRFAGAYLDQQRHRVKTFNETPAPNFTWRDFESAQHQLKDLSGKVIVLHFWASWCGPCRVEFPSLLRAANELKDDAVFLTISGDENDLPARKFLKEAKMQVKLQPNNVLYGFDPMKTLAFDVFQTGAFPETIIIDPNMNMRRKYPGALNWEDPKIISFIRELKQLPTQNKGTLPTSTQPSKIPTP